MARRTVRVRILRRWFRPCLDRLESRDAPALFGPIDNSFSVGTDPHSIAVGDFNGDGDLDLAVTNSVSNDVTVLLGSGSGGFSPAPGSPFAAGITPARMTVGDFNGDGRLDLAIANQGHASNSLTVLLGNGSGGFNPAPGSPFVVGTNPFSVEVGDFNGDGKLDLATANYDSHNVTVLLGNGSGGFSDAPGSPIAVGSYPESVKAGDFNGDGKLDFAVANALSDNVTVLLGDGSGGFSLAPGSPFAVGIEPRAMALGDFNKDGKLDLATENWGSANVTVLLGNGSGGFSPAPGSPFASGPGQSIAVSDFNGDGKLDLALGTSPTAKFVTVLLGNGSGGFSPAPGSPFAGGDHTTDVAVGDFNGDGRPDLAVADHSVDKVHILLNHGGVGATLVGNNKVTYQDLDGDTVSITLSKPLLNAGNVNDVFTFDTGTGSGRNATKQQLRAINLTGIGAAAAGVSITTVARRSPITGGDGFAAVGEINATGIDLGRVTIDGDLGRIVAGDATTATSGVRGLTVHSMGRYGTSTGAPNLNTVIQGRLGSRQIGITCAQRLSASLRSSRPVGVR